jgi:RHS repeat-associated protein
LIADATGSEAIYGLDGTLYYRDNVTTGETTDYVRMGSHSVGRMDAAGAFTWTHADHLGSASAATNSAGTIVWRESYTPFGEPIEDPAANRDEAGFTGHIRDAATGLTYAQARYYNPVTARFLAPDPVGFADNRALGDYRFFNRYAYTFNDPVNVTDPNGECPWCVGAIIGAAVGAAIDVAGQVAAGEGTLGERLGNIDAGQTIRAAGVGAVAGALGPGAPALARAGGASNITAQAVGATADIVGQLVIGAAATLVTTGESTLGEAAVGAAGGHAGRNAAQTVDAVTPGDGSALKAVGVSIVGAVAATLADEAIPEEPKVREESERLRDE